MVEFASETLAHCLHRPGRAHPADERSCRAECQTAGRHDEARGNLRQPQSPCGGNGSVGPQPAQPRVDMLPAVDPPPAAAPNSCRSRGRWNSRWNSGSDGSQPLKFSTPPLNCGSPAGMNTGPTPKRRHSRITRDRVRAAGPQPASPSRSDDPSNRLDEQRRRLDELVQELEEVSRQQLEHVSRLYKPADRSNRRRLAWHQFGF